MHIPIGGEPNKGLHVGQTPSNAPSSSTPSHSFTRDILESSGRSLGRFGIVPESPMLTPVNSSIENSIFDRLGGTPLSQGINEIKDMISAYIQSIKNNNASLSNIQDFYKVMAKIFPIATSFLSQMGNNPDQVNNMINSLMDGVVEMQQEVVTHPDFVDVPKELTALIVSTDLKNPESFKTLAQAIDTFINQQVAPKAAVAPASTTPNDVNITPTTTPNPPIEKGTNLFDSFASIIKTLNTVGSFPAQHKQGVMTLLMGSQTIKSEGLVGENLTKLNQGLTDFTLKIASQLNLIPQDKILPAKHYLSSTFDQFLLGGVLMGKTLVLKNDGALLNVKDSNELQQILLAPRQEIKIFDQIPFSFLAFYAPFKDMNENPSKAVQEAQESLINLIRIMVRLVFVLLAIQTGGSKLGEGGIDLMLKENADFVKHCIDDLIFALKKISENYGVPVKYQIAFAELANEALLQEKYPEFWKNILAVFAKDTDLEKFVKETKDADPLYEVIHSLVKTTQVNESPTPLQG